MPTKIPSIGSANWGQDLNNIFDDVLINKDGTKPVPGTDFTIDGTAYLDITRLIANDVEIYISPTGSDTNDGLSITTPFQSLTKASEFINANKLVNGIVYNVNLADGLYLNPDAVVFTGDNSINIKGNASNPSAITLKFATATGSGLIFSRCRGSVSNLIVEGSDQTLKYDFRYYNAAIRSQDGASITVSNVSTDRFSVGLYAELNSTLILTDNITINNAFIGMYVSRGSVLNSYSTLTINSSYRGFTAIANSIIYLTSVYNFNGAIKSQIDPAGGPDILNVKSGEGCLGEITSIITISATTTISNAQFAFSAYGSATIYADGVLNIVDCNTGFIINTNSTFQSIGNEVRFNNTPQLATADGSGCVYIPNAVLGSLATYTTFAQLLSSIRINFIAGTDLAKVNGTKTELYGGVILFS